MDPKDKAGFNFKQFMTNIGKETSETDEVTEPNAEIKEKWELDRKYKSLENDYEELKKKNKELNKEISKLKREIRDKSENPTLAQMFWSNHNYLKSVSSIYDTYKLKVLEDLKELLEKQNKQEFHWIELELDTDIKILKGRIEYVAKWHKFFRDQNIPINVYKFLDNDPYQINIGDYSTPEHYLETVKKNYEVYCYKFNKALKNGAVKETDKLSETEYLNNYLDEYRYVSKASELYDPNFDYNEFFKSIDVITD